MDILKKLEQLKVEEQSIIMSCMPVFERGVAEAAIEREYVIYSDLLEIFKKHSIIPEFSFSIKSDKQPLDGGGRSTLVCPGVQVGISYIVPGMDEVGRDGRVVGDKLKRIMELRTEVDKLRKGVIKNGDKKSS